MDFRIVNPLSVEDICPVTGEKLGSDAQVDRLLPFHILVDGWSQNNKDPTFSYSFDKMDYMLGEPFLSDWADYHSEEAVLRWISKKGNTHVHKLCSAPDVEMGCLIENLGKMCSTSHTQK
jgi:hypothetical protein